MDKNKNDIGRRNFLKGLGVGTIGATAAIYGCKPSNNTKSEASDSIGEVPVDKMTYRTNPHTGDKVSLIGYGCMRWPLRRKSDGSNEVDQDAVNELVDYAIAHGVNYFDTAPVYVQGWSEAATGIALNRHPRDKYFIATKLSNHRMGGTTYEEGVAMYRKSLRDLQVDYIDYYLLHSVGGGGIEQLKTRFLDNGLFDFFLKEKAAGRIRNLGWSFHGDVEVFDYMLTMDIQWDFAQIQLNYQDWQHADGVRNVNAEYLYGELTKHNVPVVVMEPLLGGRLARVNKEALTLMNEVHPKDSAAAWAFRYIGSLENVLTALSGMVYAEHIQENARTYSPLVPFVEQEYEVIEKVIKTLIDSNYIQCTECQYCMPCPYGIDIPNIFGHYNRIISAGNMLDSSTDENYKKARRAFLIGYDRNVPKLRQANHCTSCNICSPKCPQSINIISEMHRVDQYVELLKQKKDF